MINLNNSQISSDILKNSIYSNNTENVSNLSDAEINKSGNPLMSMNVGESFSGEIIDINSHQVSIKLQDNTIIDALLKQSFDLNIGQSASFMIKEKSEGQIVLKPVINENNASSELINKSLQSAGLTVNSRNTTIVSALVENGQPINRQNIVNYLKLTSDYGIDNLDSIIKLNKNGIAVNEENLEMYNKYTSSSYEISSEINNLSDNITDYFQNVLDAAVDEKGNLINAEGMQELTDFLDKLSDVLEENEVTSGNSIENVISNFQENTDDAAVKNPTENDNGNTLENFNAVNSEEGNSDTTIFKKENLENTIVEDKVELTTNDKAELTTNNKAELTTNNKAELTTNDKAAVKNTDTLKSLSGELKEIINNSKNGEEIDVKDIKSRLHSRLNNIIDEKLKIPIDENLKTDEDIKKDIEKVYDRLSKTANLIETNISGDKGSDLKNGAENLKQNLSFMNELNMLENFVQLPVKMSNQDANGSLYVYNKKKSYKPGDTLTAFLHLDLDYLGATDINVALKENNVEVSFSMDNDESKELILNHIDELSERLEKKGYKSKIYAKLDEAKEEFNPVLPITSQNENATNIKRYIFDIRT